MAKVTVDEQELLEMARKMAVVMTAINAMKPDCFKDLDIDKLQIIEFGTEVAQGLLQMRYDALPDGPEGFRQ